MPQEHQESWEDVLAALVGPQGIGELFGAPKGKKKPACKQENQEEAAPEVDVPVPYMTGEPHRHD